MSNLLAVLPDFDLSPFSHILPSLEKASISAADLLSLDAIDVAKRAHVPPSEVKKLIEKLLSRLHDDVVSNTVSITQTRYISTLDDDLDEALGGGIACGHLTEVVGESAVGKTQFMLTLLLSVQLDLSDARESGFHRNAALYISTEAPLQTTRLAQILANHPKFAQLPESDRPSLSRIHSTHVHDLVAQDHILNFQVPIAIEKHNIGLLVIDSIAANYRAEFDKGSKSQKGSEALAKRSSDIAQTGALLRELARKHGVAVVIANQVADRFTPMESASQVINPSSQAQNAAPSTQAQKTIAKQNFPANDSGQFLNYGAFSTDDMLSLDHQQRFCTGWGDDFSVTNMKTPSLGLVLTNQLSTRIALLKQPLYEDKAYQLGEERNVIGWKRSFKVVFSAWCKENDVEYEIWRGGVRGAPKPDPAVL